MKNIKKLLVAILAMVMMVSAFAGCSITKVDTLAEVAGEEVSEEHYIFKYYLGSCISQMVNNVGLEPGSAAATKYLEETDAEEGKKAIDVCKEDALEATVRLMVELKKAKDEGITLTAEDKAKIAEEDATLISQAGGEESFNKVLSSLGITKEEFTKMSENFELSNKLQAKYVSVTDEEVEAKIAEKDPVSAKHILITVNSEEEKEEKRAKAQDILSQIKAGADFDTLMYEYTEDPGIQSSPDGYTFSRGEMVEPFENASYALEENAVSDLVETDYGFHIIKRIPLMEQYKTDTRLSIQSEKYISLVDTWVSETEVTKHEDALKDVEY